MQFPLSKECSSCCSLLHTSKDGRGRGFLGRPSGVLCRLYPLPEMGPRSRVSGYLGINAACLWVPHLHRGLVCLQLHGQGLPDAQFLHVHQSARLAVYTPGLAALLRVLGLQLGQAKAVLVGTTGTSTLAGGIGGRTKPRRLDW